MRMLALIVLLGAHAALAASPGEYAMVLPIKSDSSSAAWQIELSAEAYRWSQDSDLRDLAIFNAAGQPVPMMRWQRVSTETIDKRSAELPIFELPKESSARADADLQLIVDRDASGRVQRIETSESGVSPVDARVSDWLLDSSDFKEGIDALSMSWSSPDSGVVARFNIDGSDDLQSWTRLCSDATVALFEREGIRIERRDIELDRPRFLYLRLHRLDNGPNLAQWRVIAHLRQHHRSDAIENQWVDAEPVQTLGGLPQNDKQHLYTLPASVPASRLRIDLASDNALAQLDLSTPVDGAAEQTRWVHQAQFTAYRLRQAGTEIDSGEILLAGKQRIQALRITSATRLVQSPHVKVAYTPDRLVFLAEGDGPFVLAVGSRQQRRPDYPVEAAMTSLRKQFGANWQPPLARLGAARPSAGASALSDPPEPLAWKRWLLWAVLIGAAALVGGIALSLLRSSRQGGAEDRQQPPEK